MSCAQWLLYSDRQSLGPRLSQPVCAGAAAAVVRTELSRRRQNRGSSPERFSLSLLLSVRRSLCSALSLSLFSRRRFVQPHAAFFPQFFASTPTVRFNRLSRSLAPHFLVSPCHDHRSLAARVEERRAREERERERDL